MPAYTDAELLEPRFYEQLQLDHLHESDDNPRFIDEESLERLKYALATDPKMLKARPVIANIYGEVICGNMRLRAAQELHWDSIPTYVHAFSSEAEQREWMLRDNQEYGDWVPDQLAQIIAMHAAEGADMGMLGFDDEEIAQAIRRATGDAIVPEPSASPDPSLASEAMVEIRCTHDALEQIAPTLEDWSNEIDGLEVSVTG